MKRQLTWRIRHARPHWTLWEYIDFARQIEMFAATAAMSYHITCQICLVLWTEKSYLIEVSCCLSRGIRKVLFWNAEPLLYRVENYSVVKIYLNTSKDCQTLIFFPIYFIILTFEIFSISYRKCKCSIENKFSMHFILVY